MEEEDQFFSM